MKQRKPTAITEVLFKTTKEKNKRDAIIDDKWETLNEEQNKLEKNNCPQ